MGMHALVWVLRKGPSSPAPESPLQPKHRAVAVQTPAPPRTARLLGLKNHGLWPSVCAVAKRVFVSFSVRTAAAYGRRSWLQRWTPWRRGWSSSNLYMQPAAGGARDGAAGRTSGHVSGLVALLGCLVSEGRRHAGAKRTSVAGWRRRLPCGRSR